VNKHWFYNNQVLVKFGHKNLPFDTHQFYWWVSNGKFTQGEFEGFPTEQLELDL